MVTVSTFDFLDDFEIDSRKRDIHIIRQPYLLLLSQDKHFRIFQIWYNWATNLADCGKHKSCVCDNYGISPSADF